MPAPSGSERQEAFSLLHLQNGVAHPTDDSGSEADLFAEEDYASHAFDGIKRKSNRTWRERFFWVARVSLSGLRDRRARMRTVPAGPRSRWQRGLNWIGAVVLFLIVFYGIFVPSYTRPPAHYVELRKRVEGSDAPGRANTHRQTVFIAVTLYDPDGALLSGDWASNVISLVDMLGPENVFVSIYENDATETAVRAMDGFKRRLKCDHALVYEHVDTSFMQHVTMPDGTRLLKRIAFLAHVRNRALSPLYDDESPAKDLDFDKILFLNDVVFDPIDAANLLFSTHQASDGLADYRAACAVDFTNPFKLYDQFAIRDLEGFDVGLPFYPWFAKAGEADSRNDVLTQRDAVRVKSCWGGMTAFRGEFFRRTNSTIAQKNRWLPLRFRADDEAFWDGSECCLIHADLQADKPVDLQSGITLNTEIFMNPYIRTAYNTRTLSWLRFTRRFERLYSIPHHFGSVLAGRPSKNIRQYERDGEEYSTRAWTYDERKKKSAWQSDIRFVHPGMFCGRPRLLAIPETDNDGDGWLTQYPPSDV